MIRLFTKKLPYEISRPLFFEYRDKERDIKRILRESQRKIDQDQYDMLMIVLAMSVFSNQVLSPLENASSFTKYIQEMGVSALRIRDYVLDNQENTKIKKALYHFGHIMTKFKLEMKNFDLSNLEEFIDVNIKWMEK